MGVEWVDVEEVNVIRIIIEGWSMENRLECQSKVGYFRPE